MTTSVSPVDIKKFLNLHKALSHVKYGLGKKARNAAGRLTLTALPKEFNSIDCSGYVRYMIYHSAGGFQIKDGSWYQRKWCEESGLDQVSYSEAINAKDTLAIAFATPHTNGVGDVGHVWFTYNGKTYESYSGKGVGSLAISNAWRKKSVHKTFLYPLTSAVAVPRPYTLVQSNGDVMAELPVYAGRSYVPARSWALWQGIAIHWNGEGVLYNGKKVGSGDLKLLEGTAYIPFTEAAEFARVNYVVDNEAREIRLQRRGAL